MRRILPILLLLLPIALHAEPDYIPRSGFGPNRYTLTATAGYDHNRTWGHFASFDLQTTMPIHKHLDIDARVQYQTAKVATGVAIIRPKIPLYVGELYFETGLNYKSLIRARQHEFAAAITIGYRMDYVSAAIGVDMRMSRPYSDGRPHTSRSNIEVPNICYALQVWCRPQTSIWNITARIANSDYYTIERPWHPIFMLGAQYDFDNHWRILLYAQCKPTGIFHLTANYYAATLRTGLTYRF